MVPRLALRSPAFCALGAGVLLFAGGRLLLTACWLRTLEAAGYAPTETATPGVAAGVLVVGMLQVVVGPPLEELLFRAGVTGALLRRLAEPAAVLLGAALFALAHASLAQLVPAFATGLVLGAVYARTGRLDLCILGHVAVNGLALVARAWLVPGPAPASTAAVIAHALTPVWVAGRSLALAVGAGLLVWGLRRIPSAIRPRWRSQNGTVIAPAI